MSNATTLAALGKALAAAKTDDDLAALADLFANEAGAEALRTLVLASFLASSATSWPKAWPKAKSRKRRQAASKTAAVAGWKASSEAHKPA